jgi:hypothetical protein
MERRDHGAGGDLEGLHDERPDEQREQDRDEDRLEILPPDRLAAGGRGGLRGDRRLGDG